MNRVLAFVVGGVFAGAVMAGVVSGEEKEIRIGMIGLDTSHATAFTRILNDEEREDHVPGARVVAGYVAFSEDIESSVSKVDGYVEELTDEWGVRLYDSMEAMCEAVDAVMVESVDGRPHLEQARAAIEAGKPVFIDKPMAGSLRDAMEIFRLAEEAGVPCWSASNLRFHEGVRAAASAEVGELVSVISHGPAPTEEHHPDLFWYGIHPVEALYTVMGPGCEAVMRAHTEGTDVVTGIWEDGRVGTVVGIRAGKRGYGVRVWGREAMRDFPAGGAYPELLEEVVAFFQTGDVPVESRETIEILAFMEAADESKRRGGEPVPLAEVIAAAAE
ncbi:MAG: Gfo/Idh/MocA family oxidoreductase [Verrucomicrobiota bacterium]